MKWSSLNFLSKILKLYSHAFSLLPAYYCEIPPSPPKLKTHPLWPFLPSITYPQLLSAHHLNISKTVNLTHNIFILMTYTVIFIVVLPEGFIHILYIQFLPPPTYSTPNHSTETAFTNVAKLNEDLSVLSFWPYVNAYSALKSQTLISLI